MRHLFWTATMFALIAVGSPETSAQAQSAKDAEPSPGNSSPNSSTAETNPTGNPKLPWNAPPSDGKLRILCFGAHPDDAEYNAGGVAALWAAAGHHVKFVSTTNGDAGHWDLGGAVLARKRYEEVLRTASVLGVEESEVLDIHDGELLPTLENRKTIIRLICDWQADIVIAHRPYDYHPDHRYTGILIQDASFNVTIPTYSPTTPQVKSNPVVLFYSDRFTRPIPFSPDIIVSIDDVFDRKVEAVMNLESQIFETVYNTPNEKSRLDFLSRIPRDPIGRRNFVRERFSKRDSKTADRFRDALVKYYGEDLGKKVKYAEAFEICEYGRQPTQEQIKQLFPFFPQ